MMMMMMMMMMVMVMMMMMMMKETRSAKGLSPFVFLLCIRHLPDDGCSGQPKHVALYNKRLIY
jgi:hypothetical protein